MHRLFDALSQCGEMPKSPASTMTGRPVKVQRAASGSTDFDNGSQHRSGGLCFMTPGLRQLGRHSGEGYKERNYMSLPGVVIIFG